MYLIHYITIQYITINTLKVKRYLTLNLCYESTTQQLILILFKVFSKHQTSYNIYF